MMPFMFKIDDRIVLKICRAVQKEMKQCTVKTVALKEKCDMLTSQADTANTATMVNYRRNNINNLRHKA